MPFIERSRARSGHGHGHGVSRRDVRAVVGGCPVRETSQRGRRPRAPRCGRRAAQALAFGQRGAPAAVGGTVRVCVRARRWERRGSRKRESRESYKEKEGGAVRRGERRERARDGAGTARVARDGGWFWGRCRGNVWATGEVVGGCVCVRVGGVRARVCVRCYGGVKRGELHQLVRRLGAGEPAAAEFLIEFP
jgi:hypothetical protein